jgi:TolB-like protein/DNA-binding winged helix-turn-helix (wHTH) protein/Tfp pilus assembly protein PilF
MAVMEAAQPAQLYETGGFHVDAAQRVLLTADGIRIPLASRAFDLLLYFLRHPGELLDKDRLMAAVWPNTVVEENNLNQSIGALRKALGESAGEHRFLVNEPGRGYRFVSPVRIAASGAPPAVRRGLQRRWKLVVGLAVLLIVAVIVTRLHWWPRAAGPAIDRSVAVLPFENRSVAPENEYLARGVQDEILTLLTRVGDLRVISRNSTQRYAGSAATARQIGSELGVSYLLEGSVQRAGDRVRVNVTLLDAAGDRHLWAATYDRGADEVFAVESEVAQGVARALQARLTDEEHQVITRPPSANPAAYNAYLRARAFAERTTRTESEIRAAIAAFEEAVRLDPDFAIAWAQLSRRHANLFSLAYDRSDARRSAARQALETATRLRPDLVDIEVARGYFLYVVEGDIEGSRDAFSALETRNPDSADVTAGLGQLSRELGQVDRGNDYARRTLALDPLNPYRHSIICQEYATARELDLAAQTCERALALLPGDVGILAVEATIYQSRGKLEKSRDLLRALTPAAGDWRTLRVMSRQFLLDREPRSAVALLEKYLTNADALGTRRGMVRRWLGDALRLAGDTAAAQSAYGIAGSELQDELARQPENPILTAELAIVRAHLGARDVAKKLNESCSALAARARRETFVAECLLARIEVALALDSAELPALLQEAITLRGEFPPLTSALLRLDPQWDSLRSRADFQQLH